MNKLSKSYRQFIEDNIDYDDLYKYLTADSGEYFGIYRDGTAVGSSVGMEICEDDRPISYIKCKGLGNLCIDYYTDGWLHRDEYGQYVDENGRAYTDHEIIAECCANNSLYEDLDELKERLFRDYED